MLYLLKGCRGVSDGDSGLRWREGVSDGRFWVEVTRESFRWRILGEGARGSASRSVSAVSKSSLLFVRAEKSARSLELPAATRIGIYVKLEACQARTGGIQFQRSFPRHLPSGGPSANAEHSWLEHPAPHGTSSPALRHTRSRPSNDGLGRGV